VWLDYELLQRLGLIQFLAEQLTIGREDIPWATMSMVLVLARWCVEPSLAPPAGLRYALPLPFPPNTPPPAAVAREQCDNFPPHKDTLEKHLQHVWESYLNQVTEL